MNWTIELSEEAEEQLRKLPRKVRGQVVKSIDAMEKDPFVGNVKALQGKEWKGWFRKRAGNYRIVFSPDHSTHQIRISVILLRSEKTYK
jgi:Cytotoxic translational repressor of toxin-antitoxin stability system